jgi:hypothetical protein
MKITIYLSLASIKDAKATGEAFTLKREHLALQNMKILNFFLYLEVIFAFWIRIQQLKLMRIHADQDPQP